MLDWNLINDSLKYFGKVLIRCNGSVNGSGSLKQILFKILDIDTSTGSPLSLSLSFWADALIGVPVPQGHNVL